MHSIMTDKVKITKENLEAHEWQVTYFETAAEAAEYLDRAIDKKTVGFGDSATLAAMEMNRRLSAHNKVYDPAAAKDNDDFLRLAKEALTTDVFLTSVNALSQTGEMVNIDGTGNRVAGSLFGHEAVYFVAGTNKIVPTLDDALFRARNIAAPLNTSRKGYATPCAAKGNRCYNCSAPRRICNAVTVYLQKMNNADHVEIILIGESLGF